MQTFVSWGYCASPHRDSDETYSLGVVLSRDEKVRIYLPLAPRHETVQKIWRDEGNFLYADHGAVVELSEGMHWYWRSGQDAHGTTVNRAVLEHDVTRQSVLRDATAFQCATVSVITKSLAAARCKAFGSV